MKPLRKLWSVAAVSAAVLIGATAAAADAQTITTVAGSGQSGHNGNGGPATSAALNGPRGVAWMPDGGFVFADFWNNRVRRVWPSGLITTVAGTGTAGFSGDGGPATKARLSKVHDVAGHEDGGFLIDDEGNNRIRRVSPVGIIRTVAGTSAGFSGDGGRATQARIRQPRGMGATNNGGFLVADSDNQRIRCVTGAGTITTVAGSGVRGFAGDGGQAKKAQLARPFDVAPTYDGGFLIADIDNRRVRYVSPAGIIRTVAGNGTEPDPADDGTPAPGDGGSAAATAVKPWSVSALPDGGFLLADSVVDRVRRVLPDGTITTAAGDGAKTSNGDGGPAQLAGVFGPRGLATRADGTFLVAEFGPNAVTELGGDRVRLVGNSALFASPLPKFNSTCKYPATT